MREMPAWLEIISNVVSSLFKAILLVFMLSTFASGGSDEVSSGIKAWVEGPCISIKTPKALFCTQPVK